MLNFPALSMEEYLTRRGWQPRSERGGVLYGPCPIHEGTGPNFVVYPDHFRCYTCGRHGDIIGLVCALEFSHLEGCPKQWQPVYKRVRELSGATLDTHLIRRSPLLTRASYEHPVATLAQQEMMSAAFSLWHVCLHSLEGLDAWNWLLHEGIDPKEDDRTHILGYAPPMTASLVKSFAKSMECRFGKDWEPLAEETGILLPGGKHRNQSRVMFACRNALGRILFYQGRTLLKESPNPQYKRAKYLGPMNIRRYPFTVPLLCPRAVEGTAIVEGPKSVILLGRHGITALATLGSGITKETLEGHPEPFWVLTDNDEQEIDKRTGEVKPGPGQRLAQRIIDLCIQEGYQHVQVIVPFQHNSPDVWVREEGPLPLLEVVAASGKTGVTIASKSHQNVVDLPVEVR